MASSYSTSLKIQLMANGEDSNTWGTITNTNWNLIEQAVSGIQPITMSNANYTLSNLNGVSDEARNMVLVVGGTSSVSTTPYNQIVAPLVNKFYVITNNTAGGNPITIGGSSGSLITVPNGTTVQVYCDGTNFYSAQTASAGNFNVNGNLSVGGNLTVSGSSTIVPAGVIQMWPTASPPTGFLLCTGAAVSRTTYAALFAVVGTTFGAGDGSTTFNLPNYTNRMPYGTTVGATGGSADSTLPSHTHTATVSDPTHNHTATVSDPTHSHTQVGQVTGSFLYAGGGGNPGVGVPYSASANTAPASTGITVANSPASTGISVSNSTQGVSPTGTNLPPYLGINFIIKT